VSDLSTFSKAKDWAIIALVGVIFSLLSLLANDNRRRIGELEIRVASIENRLIRMESKIEGGILTKEDGERIKEALKFLYERKKRADD
jgi:hypothetical protein